MRKADRVSPLSGIRRFQLSMLHTLPLTSKFATDFEICAPPLAIGSYLRPRRKPDDDFLSSDDTTHYSCAHFAGGQMIVLERNTP
jgi:hypothetical protein